jgi:Ca2+-binding EF-hand superfamily protein
MNVNDLVTAMEDTREAALSFGDMSAEDVAKILAKDYTKDGKVDYEKFINDYAAKESEGVFAI